MSIAPTADLERAPSDPLILFAVAAACVTLADWLFFGWDIGISLAQFLGLLGVVAVTCNRVHATRGTQIIMYGCCFLNAPWLVAYYNVEHCREVGGSGPNLDMEYLTSLGSPQTLPPIEAHLKQFPAVRLLSTAYRESPDRHFLSRSGNWRAWTFRRWRLERYFANTPGTSFNSPDNGKG